VIDTATNRVLTNIMISYPREVAFSPDGARVYVGNERSGMVSVIDTATNQVLRTIPVGNSPAGIAVSPAGARVYVCNMASHTVSVIEG
jgi:YVTN family beta-propeller protein